jgi:hypothetical protein
VLLFLAILIIDTAWEYFDNQVTTRIRIRKSKGLLHAWEQLKFEIMALGLISLLLVVFEVWSQTVSCSAAEARRCSASFSLIERHTRRACGPQGWCTFVLLGPFKSRSLSYMSLVRVNWQQNACGRGPRPLPVAATTFAPRVSGTHRAGIHAQDLHRQQKREGRLYRH